MRKFMSALTESDHSQCYYRTRRVAKSGDRIKPVQVIGFTRIRSPLKTIRRPR
jgi:hypothetical protein